MSEVNVDELIKLQDAIMDVCDGKPIMDILMSLQVLFVGIMRAKGFTREQYIESMERSKAIHAKNWKDI